MNDSRHIYLQHTYTSCLPTETKRDKKRKKNNTRQKKERDETETVLTDAKP